MVALSGGIGGAKLALGLYRVLAADELMVIANTGDDFEHMGLYITPDLDTLMYTLAGINNPDTGWGRADESWNFMEALQGLGGDDWFLLGDRDLATNVERSHRLSLGRSLTEVTAEFANRLGVRAQLLPMSDDPVRTMVCTEEGVLAFQHYFVRERCRPVVTGFRFEGAEEARANRLVLDWLADAAVDAIVICPSNPFISIDPLLAIPRLRRALIDCSAPVIAVSPIVAGKAIKGPTAKMMRELGLPMTPTSVAHHYEGLLDGFVADEQDALDTAEIGVPTLCTATVMVTLEDRERLAREVLQFATRI